MRYFACRRAPAVVVPWFRYAATGADFAERFAATVRFVDSVPKVDCPLCGGWMYGRDGDAVADMFGRHLDRDH